MSPGAYVAAAFGFFLAFVLVYVAIIAAKLQRLQRETAELVSLARSKRPEARTTQTVTREAPLETPNEA